MPSGTAEVPDSSERRSVGSVKQMAGCSPKRKAEESACVDHLDASMFWQLGLASQRRFPFAVMFGDDERLVVLDLLWENTQVGTFIVPCDRSQPAATNCHHLNQVASSPPHASPGVCNLPR